MAREAMWCYLHSDRPGTPREMRSWRYHPDTSTWELVNVSRAYVCTDCAARWDALDARAAAGEPPEMPRWLVDADALQNEGKIRLIRNEAAAQEGGGDGA